MLGVVMGGIGLVFILVSLLLNFLNGRKFRNCICETKGTVSDYIFRSFNDGPRLWYPIFQYTTGDETYRKQSNYGTSKKQFEIGEIVTVHYNPENGDEYYVGELRGNKILRTVFLISGIVLVIVGLSIFFFLHT